MFKYFLLFFIFFLLLAGSAQSNSRDSVLWTLVRELPLKNWTSASLSRNSQLLIAEKSGTLLFYDTTGSNAYQFSPDISASPSLVEAYNPLQVMVFFKDLSKVIFTDRFLLPSSPFAMPNDVGMARVATPSADNRLWVIDDSDFSLKKIDLVTQETTIKIPLDLLLSNNNYQFNGLREYQHHLYISDVNAGLLVFDNMGNFRKKLPFVNGSSWSFLGDEIYWLDTQNRKIKFFHLYKLTERFLDLPSLPQGQLAQTAFTNGEYLWLLTSNRLFCYQKIK